MTTDVQTHPALDDAADPVAVQDQLDTLRAELRRHADRLVLGVPDPAVREVLNKRIEDLGAEIATLELGHRPRRLAVQPPQVELVDTPDGTLVRTTMSAATAARMLHIAEAAGPLAKRYWTHRRQCWESMALEAVGPLAVAVGVPEDFAS